MSSKKVDRGIKAGDLVMALHEYDRPDQGITKGKIYKVIQITHSANNWEGTIIVKDDRNKEEWYYLSSFVKIPNTELSSILYGDRND